MDWDLAYALFQGGHRQQGYGAGHSRGWACSEWLK